LSDVTVAVGRSGGERRARGYDIQALCFTETNPETVGITLSEVLQAAESGKGCVARSSRSWASALLTLEEALGLVVSGSDVLVLPVG